MHLAPLLSLAILAQTPEARPAAPEDGRAGTTVVVPSPKDLNRLIEQLGSPSFKKRESAMTTLEAMRDVALEALLRVATDSPDAEVRSRAGRLAQRIQVRLAKPLHVFTGHANRVESVAFSPDGRRAVSAGAYDGTVRVWEVQTGKELRRFHVPPEEGYVSSAVFSPDGRQILTADWRHAVRLWDVETGKQVRCFRGHTNCVYCASFSPDGKLALSGSLDDTVRLWDVATGKERHCLKGHDAQVWCVTFSRDGRRALSGGADGTARLWDLDTGQELRCFRRYGDIHGVAFLPGDQQFVAATAGDVVIVDLETRKEVRRFQGHGGIIYGLALSRDGGRALFDGGDNTLRLWSVSTGREICRYDRLPDGIRSVALSPDGTTALSGGDDRMMRLWKLPR
jgi:WD40 repeat protein